MSFTQYEIKGLAGHQAAAISSDGASKTEFHFLSERMAHLSSRENTSASFSVSQTENIKTVGRVNCRCKHLSNRFSYQCI